MKLIIQHQVKTLGIDVRMALFREVNISNRSSLLERMKKELVEKMQTQDISKNPILEEYRKLYTRVGIKGHLPPAEHLINIIKNNKRLPNINTLVDSYNLVSVKTFLSIGAHDADHIQGDVTFRLTNGSEKYTPLGENKPIKVSIGEYACMDEEKILCRMDIKQCNETKITKETKEFIVYVQGNKAVESEYLQKSFEQVCELIKEIGGGSYQTIPEIISH